MFVLVVTAFGEAWPCRLRYYVMFCIDGSLTDSFMADAMKKLVERWLVRKERILFADAKVDSLFPHMVVGRMASGHARVPRACPEATLLAASGNPGSIPGKTFLLPICASSRGCSDAWEEAGCFLGVGDFFFAGGRDSGIVAVALLIDNNLILAEKFNNRNRRVDKRCTTLEIV